MKNPQTNGICNAWNTLERLRKQQRLTQREVCEYLNISDDKYRSWKSSINSMDIYSIKKLCELYNVSVEYITDSNDWTHVENEKISDLTGLSDKSIEVLRELASRYKNHTVLENGTLDFINSELERVYDTYFPITEEKKEYRLYSLFSVMNEYVNVSPIDVYAMNEDGNYSEIYSDDLRFSYANNEGNVDNTFRVLNVDELYSASRLNKITYTLTQYKEEKAKGGKTNG